MDPSGPSIPDKQRLGERYAGLLLAYEEVLDKLHHLLKRELSARELHATVKTRVKSFGSYYRKLLERMSASSAEPPRGVADPLTWLPGHEELDPPITDVMGVRIVCPFLEQIETACALVQSQFEVVHFEEKGADHSFREFGYQSTHYLVRIPPDMRPERLPQDSICEIQICTLLQDAWAEVEHELIYKAEFSPFDVPLRRKLAALNANLSLSDIIFQEIRDYQRQLHSELQRRRQDFLELVQLSGGDAEHPSNGVGEGAPILNGTTGAGSLDELLLQALYAHNARKYPQAIKYYGRILAEGPSIRLETIVLVHRGMAHFANRDYVLALEDFKQAIKCDPQNAKAFYYRGILYHMNHDNQKALRDLDRSLELSPYEFDTLLSRSRVRLELGDRQKALEDCENALRIEPEHEEALELQRRLVARHG